MDSAINYIFESSISLGLFVILYRLWFKRNPIIWFNRIYLLFSMAFSVVLPFIHITINQSTIIQENMINEVPALNGYYFLDSINVVSQSTNQFLTDWIGRLQWINILYLVGLLLLLIRVTVSIFKIFQFKKSGSVLRQKNYILIDLKHNLKPFSFFNFIFVNHSKYQSDEIKLILNHELAHVRLKHSYDILFLELILIVQWFNPFVWFIRNDLKEIHEFQADEVTLQNGANLTNYKQLLVYQTVGTRFDFASNFSQLLIKKRLKMMNFSINRKHGVLRYTSVFLLTIMLLVVFGNDLILAETSVTNTQEQTIETSKNEDVFVEVDVMPQFPGGNDSLINYINSNVTYPIECMKNSIEGRVYIQFEVDKKGQVKNANVVRSIDKLLDAEALRVVKSLPQWKPGEKDGKAVNVQYNVPVNFVLSNNDRTIGEDENVFVIVEEMPKFPGGEAEMHNYITSNIEYPEEAKKNGIQGRVHVQFVVNTNGLVSNVKIVRGVDPLLDVEAMRVIMDLPKWEPGAQRGKKVNVQFIVPVNFSLN